MNFGREEMWTALNVSAITSLLDTDSDGKPALYPNTGLPSQFLETKKNKSINYFMGAPTTKANIEIYQYNINCRGGSFTESLNIAKAVITQINRRHYGTYYITAVGNSPIPPADKTDNHNTPVTATIQIK
jgi:hypothetical protein